jgi:hypothetical protein
MSYVVIKTINGRRYRYLQRSYRVGKKVRTESLYLGPADGGIVQSIVDFVGAQRTSAEDRALATAERQAARIDEEQRAMFGETAAERSDRERQEHLDKLNSLYGLTLGPANPTPVDKEMPAADQGNPAPASSDQAAPEKAEASVDADGGEASGGGSEGAPQ